MIKPCKYNQNNVIEKVRNGQLDALALSSTNLIDDIILEMNNRKIFDCLKTNIPDLRAKNTVIPYELIWASAICAKMKVQTSLTDIPFAIHDHRTLVKLGYTLIDTNGNLKEGLMQEGSLRFLLNKYNFSLFIDGYNCTVQNGIFPLLNIVPDIHILDCTDLEVNYFNCNYEKSGVSHSKRNNSLVRGYKLATLRGIVNDTGLIEDIRFGSINTHDLINFLKTERKIDIYAPLKKNMEAYQTAISIAKSLNDWSVHPNKKRKDQFITLVEHLDPYWTSENSQNDVPINGCVVWDKKENEYYVLITTDTARKANEIIMTYELRPEIEEDYRQLKDFWKIEDFKSTKINIILFHIVCVLFGYLFFQLYTLFPEGADFLHRSLPVILKNYIPQVQPYVVLYVGYEFGILTLLETMELYARCDENTRKQFKKVLEER